MPSLITPAATMISSVAIRHTSSCRSSPIFPLTTSTFRSYIFPGFYPSSLHVSPGYTSTDLILRDSVSLLGSSLFSDKRNLTVAAGSMEKKLSPEPPSHPSLSSFRGSESFFRNVLANMETVYLNRNPTAKAVLDLVSSFDDDRICYDHFAFRTFGINAHGIDSMAKFFLDFGYTQREELRFPAKKLKAFWFSPPEAPHPEVGSRVTGPLPRIFISELLVDQMSPEAQGIIKKYTDMSGDRNKYAALASALGFLTWEKPSYSEFQKLAKESEYAAWTLVNGYALNHVTISTHQLKSHLKNINNLNQFVEENGYKLNSEGGILKVSPDGFLLQSSTVADSIAFHFSDGITERVPCSYIEFAERLVLPQYKDLAEEEVKEFHRRDGFEVGNADKIFESTSTEQLNRKIA